jgi:hypothetical protein
MRISRSSNRHRRVPGECSERSCASGTRPGTHMWTAPTCKRWRSSGSDRLRSYVRSVDGGAHDRLPRWVPRSEFLTAQRFRSGAAGSLGVSRIWDRSITPSAPSQASSGLSAGRQSLPRRTRYASVIAVVSRDLLRDSSEGRGAEPPRSAALRPSRAAASAKPRSGL